MKAIRITEGHRKGCFLQGPKAPRFIKSRGYSFSLHAEVAWPFPNETQALAKARIVCRHMQWGAEMLEVVELVVPPPEEWFYYRPLRDPKWCFRAVPNGMLGCPTIAGFKNRLAAAHCAARYKELSCEHLEMPSALYEPFKTPSLQWGFFAADGELHAGFDYKLDAMGMAAKMKGASRS